MAPYPYCYRCPVNQKPGECELECFGLMDKLVAHQVKPSTVAAIIKEPILGEGGYVVPATGYKKQSSYMSKLREFCDKHGILLIFDEVQSGFGRTGQWFACENWGVEPDILIMAKGIASGFPMAAIISRKELMDKWTVGRHGSTYGGNPVACAAALANIKVIESQQLLAHCRQMGEQMRARLLSLAEKFLFIGEIRGIGLMNGIEIVDANKQPDGDLAARIIEECFKRKLLLLDCGAKDHVLRLLPPLNVSADELNKALTILEEAFVSVSQPELAMSSNQPALVG
jgi:4-aminobutyrate aminotransferase